MNKELLNAALVRAERSFLQAIIVGIPEGFVITPYMIEHFNIEYVYVIVALLATALLYAFASFCHALLGGLPEATYQQSYYMDAEEPPDSYIEEATEREIGIGGDDHEE